MQNSVNIKSWKLKCRTLEFFYILVIFATEVEHSGKVGTVSYRNNISKILYGRVLLSVTHASENGNGKNLT